MTRLTDDRLNEIRARLCSNACAYAAGDCFAHELLDHIEALTAERPVEREVQDGELYKQIQRILDEHSAWIARPSNDVTKAITVAAAIWAHRYDEALTTRAEAAEKALEEAREPLELVARGLKRGKIPDQSILLPYAPDATEAETTTLSAIVESALKKSGK